jgi:hypothetical protein
VSGDRNGEESGMDPGRRAHYRTFYDASDGDAVAVVWGNCQAEALRVVLATSPTFPLPTVRVPPVHELVASDLAPLRSLLTRTAVLVTQPVRPNYRGLAVGTDELVARLAPSAAVVRWPVVRYVGLHPFAAIVRGPEGAAADPPVVPYHDLRTLARAAGRTPRRVLAAALREVAQGSVGELARREQATDVAISDVFASFGAAAVHTVNHPGNGVLVTLARRIQRRLGLAADADDPGRELLGRLRAPLEAPVIEAMALDAPARPDWHVDGGRVDASEVEAAHLDWYGAHPDIVDGGLRRHAARADLLGL